MIFLVFIVNSEKNITLNNLVLEKSAFDLSNGNVEKVNPAVKIKSYYFKEAV